MPNLEPPDTFYLSAAIGWLELGNLKEAEAEWAKINPAQQNRAEVLEVRWQILASANQWAEALKIARQLIGLKPDKASHWIHQAYALRRVTGGGLQAAFDALLPALEKFPKEPIIPYNLACYLAQLGQLDPAWQWLKRAMAMAKPAAVKRMALADPDLAPLWVRLRAKS